MIYRLDWLPGFPSELLRALERTGIHDTRALLEVASDPEGRAAFSASAGVPLSLLETWVSVADLCRLPALSPANAILVVESGLARTVQDFASQLDASGSAAPPDTAFGSEAPPSPVLQAHARLRAFVAGRPGSGRVPDPDTLADAARESREIAPRVLFVDRSDERDVDEALASIRARTLRFAVRNGLATVVAITLLAAAALGILAWGIRTQLVRGLDGIAARSNAPGTSAILDAVRVVLFDGIMVHLGGIAMLVGSVLAFLVLLLVAHEALGQAWRSIGFRTLLRSAEARRTYLETLTFEAGELGRYARTQWLVLALFGTVGILVALLPRLTAWTDRDPIEVLLLFAAGIVPITIVVTLLPTLRFLLRRSSERGPRALRVVRDVTAYSTFALALQVLFLSGAIFAFPRVITEATTRIQPVTEARLEAYREHAIATLDAALAAHPNVLDATADEAWDGLLGPLLDPDAFADPHLAGEVARALGTFAAYLTPSLVLGALLGLVVPFLIMGGWLRGAFFVVLLATLAFTESGVERYLTSHLSSWFRLSEGSTLIPLLSGAVMFGNAIAFEWIFELMQDRPDTCRACGADVTRDASFCGSCGMGRKAPRPTGGAR